MAILTSSNPVLSDSSLGRIFNEAGGAVRTNTATVQGVMAKTSLCTMLAIGAGAVGYTVVASYPGLAMVAWIAALVVSLVAYFAIWASPKAAMVMTPLYSIAQGLFLGCLSFALEGVLAAQQIAVPGGLALQAFLITGSLMAAMLALHTFGIVRAGPRFTSVLSIMTLGVAIMYLVAFVLSLFGTQVPFLSLGSALQGGTPALVGLGINLAILLLASLWLLVDLAQIDSAVAAGAPKSMEWMLAFGLVVTLAWVYLEALKLAFRLAAMFNSRD